MRATVTGVDCTRTQQAANTAGSQTSTAPMRAAKASSTCNHRAISQPCWLTAEHGTDASHEGKHQLHTAGSDNAGPQKSPAPMQAAKTSNNCKLPTRSHPCWLAAKPSADASRAGERQQQAHSGQQALLAHKRAQHRCKPRRQASTASTKRAAQPCWLVAEPSTDASTRASIKPIAFA